MAVLLTMVLYRPQDEIGISFSFRAHLTSTRPHVYRSKRGMVLYGPLSYLIASGLTGEPTAPVIGMAGATNRNS